jgi:hypothetical protein
MNSRNVCFGAHPRDELQDDPVGHADQAISLDASPDLDGNGAPKRCLNTPPSRQEELSIARAALECLPGLSAERVRLLRERIQQGYYTQQNVAEKVAARLTDDLMRPLD